MPEEHFSIQSIQSQKEDLMVSTRRFTLGIQARGLHLALEEINYIEEHATTAENLQHPHAAAMELFLSCGIVRLPKCSTECASGGFRTWLLE